MNRRDVLFGAGAGLLTAVLLPSTCPAVPPLADLHAVPVRPDPYAAWLQAQLHGVATAMSVPYALLVQDYDACHVSSVRAYLHSSGLHEAARVA